MFPKEVWLRFIKQVIFELDRKVGVNQEEKIVEEHVGSEQHVQKA